MAARVPCHSGKPYDAVRAGGPANLLVRRRFSKSAHARSTKRWRRCTSNPTCLRLHAPSADYLRRADSTRHALTNCSLFTASALLVLVAEERSSPVSTLSVSETSTVQGWMVLSQLAGKSIRTQCRYPTPPSSPSPSEVPQLATFSTLLRPTRTKIRRVDPRLRQCLRLLHPVRCKAHQSPVSANPPSCASRTLADMVQVEAAAHPADRKWRPLQHRHTQVDVGLG